MLVTMKDILDHVREDGYCLPAPNVVCEVDARAAIAAGEEANTPLILDIAHWHHPDMIFLGQIVRRLAEQTPLPVAINIDHGKSVQQLMDAFRAGFTSVMCDFSMEPFDIHVQKAQKVVEFAHAVGLTVEAELGHVGEGSNYAVDGVSCLTDPQEARAFVEQTGVDALAVAIGTAHGFYQGEPKIDVPRLDAIREACKDTGVHLVLHGGSNTGFDKLQTAAAHGITKLNVGHDLWYGAIEGIKAYHGNESFFWGAAADGYKCVLLQYFEALGATGKAWKCAPESGRTWYFGTDTKFRLSDNGRKE